MCLIFAAEPERQRVSEEICKRSETLRGNGKKAEYVFVSLWSPLMSIRLLEFRVVHGLGRPTGWVGLGWVGSRFFSFLVRWVVS